MQYQDKNFFVNYPVEISQLVTTSIKYAQNKRKLYCELFATDGAELGQLKVAFFTDRSVMVDYIIKHNEYGANYQVPTWAVACFANDEIQIYVNPANEKAMRKRYTTISHELLHLFFKKYIYEKYQLARVRWLDESFACALEKEKCSYADFDFAKLANELNAVRDLDLNLLDDRNNLKPKDQRYDGYQIFHLVGEYIKRNNLYRTLLTQIKNDYSAMRTLGKTILATSIDYFCQF